VRRWHAHRHSEESGGHLYQGAYKSFPVENGWPFLSVARYVERNALRAGLVKPAEEWRWCSLWRRERGTPAERAILSEWPGDRPADWLTRFNRA
jgi:putative transposase